MPPLTVRLLPYGRYLTSHAPSFFSHWRAFVLVSPCVVFLVVGFAQFSHHLWGSAKARDPVRATARHWNWVPFPGGPPSLSPPMVVQRGEDKLGFLGVANPLRRDGRQRHA